MSEEKATIAEAAQAALRAIGRPASVDEIYAEILNHRLYEFNTPTPEHVLRTTIRRQMAGSDRIDSRDPIVFEMVGDEIYAIAAGLIGSVKKGQGRGMKRIQRAGDKEEIIKSLMGDQVGVFKEIWRLLLFAAQVGMKDGKREPLKAVDTGKGIDQTTFGNCPAWPGILYLMSLVETGQSECLGGASDVEDDRIVIFQEYANRGLTKLKEFFSDRNADLDGLLAFIEIQRGSAAGLPDLELTI